MNDELQKQIAQVLKQALQSAQQGGQWLAGQIPDVLNQLILWTVCMGGLALAAIVAIAWVNKRVWQWANSEDAQRFEDRGFARVLVAILSLAISAGLSIPVMQGLQALIAPKLFLLEYAAHFLK